MCNASNGFHLVYPPLLAHIAQAQHPVWLSSLHPLAYHHVTRQYTPIAQPYQFIRNPQRITRLLACGTCQSSITRQSLGLHVRQQFISLTPQPGGRLIGQSIQRKELLVEHHNASNRIKHHYPLRQQTGQQSH
ncbi:hypothetical protein BEN48_05470 [Hymenobacter glacialis]|uniref:Uncharacterized protein n=1 Tax=Hymenobacter glacialis TaxID=1908236 RepID=A0A1G1SSU4_9BACT|nr:hypothetical protein BEN48_05470 [Hymenobacter glacialis]